MASTFRKDLIRLAHENPGEVREALLPLLRAREVQGAREYDYDPGGSYRFDPKDRDHVEYGAKFVKRMGHHEIWQDKTTQYLVDPRTKRIVNSTGLKPRARRWDD